MKEENYFEKLNSINVNDKTEEKNGLTYLSWAWAWGEVKKIHPDTNYKIYEDQFGYNYFNDGKTGWVKTGVIVNGIEHIEYLPIMDYRNKSITLENITSFDVNKAIQRSLTKALARHGLGLYIYAGEDLPEGEETPSQKETQKKEAPKKVSLATEKQKEIIKDKFTKEEIKEYLKEYKKSKLSELTVVEASKIISNKINEEKQNNDWIYSSIAEIEDAGDR